MYKKATDKGVNLNSIFELVIQGILNLIYIHLQV